jgi:ketosteroid isomerase-like protein
MESISDRPTVEKTAAQTSSRGWLLLLVGLVVGAGVTIGITQLAQTESSTEALIERWITAMNDQDIDELLSLYSEDVIWEDEATGDRFEGHSGIRKGNAVWYLAGFQQQDLTAVAIDGDIAVIRWTIAGTKSPWTGEPWHSTGLTALEISEDKITAETVYYDSRDIQ